MMREYLLYYQGKVIGGIYDNRLLLKSTPSATLLTMHIKQDYPYQGAKPMLLIDDKDIENHPFLTELIQIISKDLEKLPN
ncbi:transcriptional regulator [Gallibacterium genomosp. 2]|uniref:transcriptional regulator n=1 Tax=Gallibacterium genomosp. 2 TaxID=155517 RepID=UPI000AA87BF1|nr:transcriptional regulator [Gallibacterium genomosp. 2]